ncbi:AMP-binding protein [Jannaschia aquimarina]|uniref:AcsA_3 protein n=2 Tax=Jannaschia aquimarina TaxID=935700 RepID=A0A0D1EBU8_9RHOB|nr:AMP-binding protein [Jannaschia aquimarina]KIT14331.1 Acetyl-coenzyme A synthetase [Jannaschia aquimarina]SNS86302.1 acetyl-CoA synthetase [Jannaschia aquimarina]
MHADFRWNIPERFNIAAACCDAWAETDPDGMAVVDLSAGRRVWTYLDLKRASDALAAHLAGQGVGRGDRVAILLPQRAEVLVAHFAAMKLGAISLPLFTLFGPEALSYRLKDSGAVAVIADAEGLAKVADLQLPDLKVGVDADALPEHGQVTCAETHADDPAMMIYTSGTTGDPKGVLHAHRFLFGHLPCVEAALEGFPKAGDVGWTPADWAWIGGLMDLALPCLWFGVPLVARRFGKFDAAAAWDLIAAERVTAAFLPPTALKLMRRTPVPKDATLRVVMSGGEALGADLVEWGRTDLSAPINEIYGQTEVNLVMAACAGTQDVEPGTLGRAVPGVDVEVQRDDGVQVPVGQVGEICVRGSPAAFLRYWNKPEETAKKWRDGWIRTGDLGVRLADGVIRYHARDDDVITSAGYRIGPTEIENCLNAHPSVVMAAVVGLPDPERGAAVTAFVVPEGRVDGLEAELIAWVRARLSPHMAPRSVRFREALPMTATGKVMRRALRDG